MMWVLLLCLISVTTANHHAMNWIFNPSFEIKEGARASGWNAGSDYVIDWNVKRSGLLSIRTHSGTNLGSDGAFQVVVINQEHAYPIRLGAWSKADCVEGKSGSYGVLVHVRYCDGSWRRDYSFSFSNGSHDWEYKELYISPNKPIQEVWIFVSFAEHSGTAWFDDFSLSYSSGDSGDCGDSSSSDDQHGASSSSSSATSMFTSTTSTPPPFTPSPTPTISPLPPASSGIFTSTGRNFQARADSSTGSMSPFHMSGLAGSFSGSTAEGGQTLTVGAKYLVLTPTSNDERLAVVKTTLDSVGMPYDVMVFNDAGTGIAGKTITLEEGAKGMYMGLIATDDFLLYDDTYQQALNNYQIKYGVKMVTMYTYPSVKYGVKPSPISPATITGYLEFSEGAIPYTSGYNVSMVLPSSGVYTYPAEIITEVAKPAMTIRYEGSPIEYVAAAFVHFPDGRKSLQFYVDHGTWAFHSTALGSFWLQWLNNGLYLGVRRVNLNMQIDDLFMESEMWDPVLNNYSETVFYRSSADDLSALASWQTSILQKLPPTSKIISTFPFNGLTVTEHGGYTSDLLYLRTKTLLDNFFFESHTYTHPYLDAMNYADVMYELTENYKTAQNLFSSNMGHPSWSPTAMVTPSITGLFNPQALKALYDYGIRSVVGDNSRPELVPSFKYHGIYTTVEANGFNGIYIVPRFATDVYYCSSLPEEEEALFNFRYESYFGKKNTLKEIMQKEADRARGYLMSYRQDPYMFHQANLRQFSYEQQSVSLVSLWADYVTTEFMKYSTLPIRSQKSEELAKIWQARESRDACMFSADLNLDANTKQITSISVSSVQACSYAITGLKTTDGRVTSEAYGPDSTSWFQMTPGSAFSVTPSEVLYI